MTFLNNRHLAERYLTGAIRNAHHSTDAIFFLITNHVQPLQRGDPFAQGMPWLIKAEELVWTM